MSQLELAERADLDPTYPSLLERGIRMPTVHTFMALARAFNIAPDVWMKDLLAEDTIEAGLKPTPHCVHD